MDIQQTSCGKYISFLLLLGGKLMNVGISGVSPAEIIIIFHLLWCEVLVGNSVGQKGFFLVDLCLAPLLHC